MNKSLRLVPKRTLVLILGILGCLSVYGADFIVNQTGGDRSVNGTFAWAIDQANASAANDRILINVATIDHTGPTTSTTPWPGAPNGTSHQWTITKNSGNLEIIGNNGGTDVVIDGSLLNDPANDWKCNILAITGAEPAGGGGTITIRNIEFTNAPQRGTSLGGGIILSTSWPNNIPAENVTIVDCQFYDCAGPGMLSYSTTGNFTNINLTDCISFHNGQSGVSFQKMDGFTVTRGSFYENGESGIQFQSEVANGLIDDVDAYSNGIPGLTSNTNANNGAGIRFNQGVAPSSDVIIQNSRVYGNNIHGIEFAGAVSNSAVVTNQIYDNGKGTVANPANGAQGAGVVMQFGGSSGNTVASNNIYDNADCGIYMYRIGANADHSDNIFYDNDVTGNGGGIVVLSSSGSFIAENRISNNVAPSGNVIGGEEGIFFGDNSDNGVVVGNTITNADFGNGILITDRGVAATGDGSDNVYILDNTIQNTSAAASGIRVENSDDSHIGDATGAPSITRTIAGYGTITINPTGVLQNSISGTTVHAIDMYNSDGVDINGAFIGTSDGTNPGINTGNGINLDECTNVEIGTTQRNIISGSPSGYGIYATNSDNIQIDNNYIGTDLNGTTALPNGSGGVFLGATNNSNIGSNGRNIISGNGGDGIEVSNNATLVTIEDNYVGLDVTGNAVLANTGTGINMTGANQNTVENNYVSGNGSHGIFVQSATSSTNTIRNNNVGLLVNGNDGGNGADGIRLDQCVDNTIEANNVGWNDGDGISLHGTGTNGNDLISNYIGIDNANNVKPNDGNGIYIASVATNNQIGNVGTGNFISGNGMNGIMIDGSSGNNIDGNTVGLNTTRTAVIPNGAAFSGVHITGATATSNVIGDLARNYIAGPHTQQILLDNGANGNEVRNVTLGDQTLAGAAQSTGNAILITGTGTDNNIVGGVIGTDENFIYHSNNVAVLINAQASSNTVKSNIFESVGATSPISAIQVNNGNDNIIGGAAADQGNVISTTSSNAIVVDGTSDGNQVQFNYIGVDQNEASVGPIQGHGIFLDGAGVSNTIINENVIGNVDDAANAAVFINGVSAISTLYGNYVGITRNDLAIANTGHGIWVTNSSDAVSVGTVGQNPNVISNNALNGVEVDNSTTTTVVNNFIGTNVAGTTSVGNGQNGVHFGTGNTGVGVYGNLIQGNTQDGILIDNEIGGTTIVGDGGTLGGGNRLLDNGGHGVNVTTGTATNLTISSNGIGVVTGNASTSGNTGNGINIENFSGTALINNDNIIGGNNYGIELNGATGVTIDGNFVGMSNNNPSENLANTLDGIYVHTGSNNNTINGNALGFSNENAIEIDGVSGTTISGNRIGVADLTTLQDVGNTLNGIAYVNGASGGTISGNLIGFNDNFGISLDGATGVTVDGNFIGADTQNSTSDLRNDVDGISLLNGANGNTISSNTIAHHNSTGATGLRIDGAASIQNTISQNNMYCNEADQSASATPSLEGNGINLENDGNDLYPNKITGVVFSTVQPILDGTRLYMEGENLPVGAVVEIFQSDDNCVNCQGKTYISQTTVDASGEWTATVTAAQTYVVTLRDPGTNNTSEFSACSTTPPCTPPVAEAGDDGSTCENTLFDLSTRTIVADSTGSGQNGTILWEAFDGWADGSPALAGGTFSSTTILNPTYTPPTGFEGVVKLRMTVSNNPCTPALDSIQLTVEPQPVANAGGDASICEGTALDLSGRTTVADSTGSGNAGTITWTDGGAGGAFNDASLLNPIYTPVATTGTVTLTMEVDGNSSCTPATDNMVITINPEPTATTVTTNSETCSDTPITLAVGDVTATNYDAISWAVTTGNGSITAGGTTLTPTYTPSTGTPEVATVTLTMTATAITPCATDATTPIDIAITPAPTADAGNDQATCVDVAYTLDGSAATTNSPSMSWAVTTGNGTITAGATTLTPTYTPATADAGTTVVLTLTADGNNSCNAQTSTMNLAVNALPTPTVTGEQAPCPNASEPYGISGVTATPFIATWTNSIDPSIGTDNGDNTYTMNYGLTGLGNITATVTDNNGCIASVDYAVNVLDNPTVTVATTGVCETNNQVFTASAIPSSGTYNYTWYTGTPGFGTQVQASSTSSTYNASSTNPDYSNGDNIYVEIVPTNCPASLPVSSDPTTDGSTVDFADLPTASITGPTVICSSESATLVAGATGVSNPSYAWTSPNGNNGSASSYTGDTGEGGTYSLVVTNGDDPTGVCQASTTYDVSVVTVDVSAIASEYDVDEGTDVTISATPDTYSSYSWVTSDGDDKGTATSFTETLTETTTYIVTATEGNCDDVAEVTVNVRALVIVPSMFTPGNGDGRNDYWILTNIEDYPEAVIKVYNRWGNIVYEGPGGDTYFNDPWDGTRGGVEVPTAVYYYVIDLKYKDIILAGDVTIMR